MSSFTLKMTFTGLCAFVPHTSGKRMRVLLVDGQQSVGTHEHEDHFAALVFDMDNYTPVSGPNRPLDMQFKEDNKERGLCIVEREELVVSPQSGEPLMFNNEDLEECPQANRDHFSWVAPIPQIVESSKSVDSSCFVPIGGKIHKMLAGRLALTHGKLITSALAEHAENDPLLWNFFPNLPLVSILPLSPRRQALAEEVEWTLPVDATEIRLASFKFGGSEGPVLRLQPTRGVVQAAFRNLPLPDIVKARKPSHPREKEPHFEHYYAVSKSNPGIFSRRIPFLDTSCNSRGPITASNPKCPPARFDKNPDA